MAEHFNTSDNAQNARPAEQSSPENLRELPLLPLADMIVFPRTIVPLYVGKDQSMGAVERAYKSRSRHIFLSLARQDGQGADRGSEGAGGPVQASDIEQVGVICRVSQMFRMPDGSLKTLFEGLNRARVVRVGSDAGVPCAAVEVLAETRGDPAQIGTVMNMIRESLQEMARQGQKNGKLTPETLHSMAEMRDPAVLADTLISRLSVSPQGKQKVLEILDQGQRLEEVYGHLVSASTTQTLEKRIRARVREQMDKSQREYYLTEQIKAINKELGRDFDPQEELNTLEKRLKEKELPDAARERGLAEVKKLRGMTTMAPEYTILHTYVDWILDLPWTKMADADIDIDRARSILDNNHYGIEKPKERILEYLAVQKLSKGLRGPILCLVGPPGVGKTSLAKSVAEATGREYVRLSLGGVRDEAEIRGHRRTYIGALPGKIIQSLKRVKTSNPLFCLDEIDKMTCSERGDPAAALLEVLDPEQNATYMDHYLDLDYDLSKVFFITTANSLDGIPGPLLDRMEVIELHSYLETEKFHIARSFLIPRQVAENSVKPENLGLPDETLRAIIREYTAEAGVRALERRIAKLCRRAAIEMLGHKDLNFRLDVAPGDLAGIFGAATSRHDRKEEAPGVGVCTGLAWTRMGGEILFVETGIMAGTGVVSTTGKLGEVMQESARAALSYVRSHASELGLAPDFHKKVDIHVHVPDGATPKDGPSAGITIATALVSALLNIPVRDDVAMTGEISLRGRVLPIGGLREKLLAAKRAGIFRVIMPKENERDLLDVPAEVKEGMDLIFVEHVNEVLPLALAADREEIFPGASAEPLWRTLRADFAPIAKGGESSASPACPA